MTYYLLVWYKDYCLLMYSTDRRYRVASRNTLFTAGISDIPRLKRKYSSPFRKCKRSQRYLLGTMISLLYRGHSGII